MRIRRGWLIVLLLLALGLGLLALWQVGRLRKQSSPPAPPVQAPAESPTVRAVTPAGFPAVRPDGEWVERAVAMMASPADTHCGPYRLLTDTADDQTLATCAAIGSELETVYRERFGLEPVGDPRGAILLFADRESFRQFAESVGFSGSGYSGFSRATRGVVAMHTIGEDELARTLAHELTHLVHRRAFGSGLAPWLSEGLADAIGDAAGTDGLGPLTGFAGVGAQRERLRSGYDDGAVDSLQRLTELDRAAFDRGLVSFDYEQAALLVRFLLADPARAEAFRDFLRALAVIVENGAPKTLPQHLGTSWPQMESDFRAWLEATPDDSHDVTPPVAR